MKKSLDYIFGIITGISIMIDVCSCTTSKLYAYESSRGDSRYNPLYVKVVE